MRSRSIKPGICTNELLGTADPFYTLLFERLWMMADREGRLQDRPLKIKAEAFPYREGLDVEPMLVWLHENKFITRYEIGGARYIQILEFKKHQSPHQKECASTIQAPDSPGARPMQYRENPALAHLTPSSLTPDSGLLTADSSSLRSLRTPPARAARKTPDESPEFDEIRRIYPRRSGGQRWSDAAKAYAKRRTEGHTHDVIVAGVSRYAAWCTATGKVGTETVQQAATFFGDNKGFLEPWSMPRAPPQAENISPGERVMRAYGGNGGRVVAEQFGSGSGDVEEPFGRLRPALPS